MTIKLTYNLSPSSLGVLKDCPRCFWLQFNKGIKRPEGIFPSLPSGMDRILKQHFDMFMQKGALPPELCELHGFSLFSDPELMKTWRDNRKGIQWKDEQGNLLRGAVDNILVHGKKLVVLDYKTRGYPLKDDTAGHYQNQMDLYNFLLRKNGHETEDFAYLLFYHPDKLNENGDVLFHTDLVKLGISVANAEKILKTALDALGKDAPAPSAECKYCEWARNSTAQP